MKISDDKLREIIETIKDWQKDGREHFWRDRFLSIATELQQHRADKRWRKIADEIPHLGEKVLLFLNNGDYDIGMMRLRGIQANTYGLVDERDDINIVAWKPLPTDLPEEE